jgi:transposase
VKEVSERIGVSPYSLYKWIKKDPRNTASGKAVKTQLDDEAEVVRLKAEVKRVQEERDILRKSVRI